MNRQHRTNYTKQFKSNLVEEFRKGSVDLPEFAAAHGVKVTTFKNWVYRKGRGSADETRGSLDVAEAWGFVEASEIVETLELIDRICAMLWRLTH